MRPEVVGIIGGLSLLLWSTVHDHLYSRGERRTTFFHWTGSSHSLLLNWADSIREAETKNKIRRRK